jgi:hypothetical protein
MPLQQLAKTMNVQPMQLAQMNGTTDLNAIFPAGQPINFPDVFAGFLNALFGLNGQQPMPPPGGAQPGGQGGAPAGGMGGGGRRPPGGGMLDRAAARHGHRGGGSAGPGPGPDESGPPPSGSPGEWSPADTVRAAMQPTKIPGEMPFQEISRFAQDRGFTVTSTTGDHHLGWAHKAGYAADIRTKDHTDAEVNALMQQARDAGYTVIDEREHGNSARTGPHLHIQKERE